MTSNALKHEILRNASAMLSEPIPTPPGPRYDTVDGEIEIDETPTVRAANNIMIHAFQNSYDTVTIGAHGRRTQVDYSDPSGRHNRILLPAFAMNWLTVRYVNLVNMTVNDHLVIEGTIPVRYENRDYRVTVHIEPRRSSVQIELRIAVERDPSRMPSLLEACQAAADRMERPAPV